jgi:hypothetical protein
LAIGNEIWRNFGQDDEIDNVQIFFRHEFYVQFFQIIYPELFNFLQQKGYDDIAENDHKKMAECIQSIIDLL